MATDHLSDEPVVAGRDPRKLAMLVSLFASAIMLTGKMIAALATGSVALFADAAESVVHGLATAMAAFSLWYADRPADSGHRYGHGRIVYFSAGFEGALVCAAGVAIIVGGVHGLITGAKPHDLAFGLGIASVLAVINLVLGLTLVRIGRRHNAFVLVANGKHVLSDMLTTAAAIAGVGLVMITDIAWLDPITALGIGGFILYTGAGIVREAVGGLMDRVEPEVVASLETEMQRHRENGQIAGFHQLRCRKVNDELWVDVHLLLPGDMTMHDAHARATRLERSLRELPLPEKLRITSHIEPADHEAAHPGGHREELPTDVDPTRA